MIKNILMVGLGGACGSMLRFLCQKAFALSSFPIGTLLVNIAGCFLIGLLWGLVARNTLNDQLRLLLMTGFCGGFTTFSSFSYEGMELLLHRRWIFFLLYTGTSIFGGLVATLTAFRITT